MANTEKTDLESHCAVTDPEMKGGFAASERANTLIGRDLVINEGMEVIGSDGHRIGQVKEIREKDFLVDRRKGPRRLRAFWRRGKERQLHHSRRGLGQGG